MAVWPIQGFAESSHSSNQSEIVCTAVVQAFVLLCYLFQIRNSLLSSLSLSERHSELHRQGKNVNDVTNKGKS